MVVLNTEEKNNESPAPAIEHGLTWSSSTSTSEDEEVPPASASALSFQQREEIVSLLEARTEEAKSREDAKPQGNLLPKDSFSFLAFGSSEMRGPAFYIGLVTFTVQLLTLTIVMMDQLYSSEQTPDNRLGVPPFVTWSVRASQFIAILISVMLQMDVIWSVNVFYKGYNRQAFQDVLEFEGKTMPKSLAFWWHVSAWSRLIVGLFCLVVMFMLIVKSETGRAVLLSFNAVNFIGGFDNAVFAMAQWDYFGSKAKETADSLLIGDVDQAIEATSLHLKKRNSGEKKGEERILCRVRHPRNFTMVAIFLILEAFWLWLTLKSINGDYLPSSIYVQFGDDEEAEFGLLSGIYDLQTTHESVKWVARPDQTELPEGSVKQFRYCKSQLFWVFETRGTNEEGFEDLNRCEDWLAKSSTTGVGRWNILTVANKKWSIRNVQNRKGSVQMKYLRMMQREEQCPQNTYGPLCEFFDPCDTLAIDATAFNMETSWGIYGVDLSPEDQFIREFFERLSLNKESGSTSYRMLNSFFTDTITDNLVLSHERPVWVSEMHFPISNTSIVETYATYEVIMCLGRRWARMVVGIPAISEESELTKRLRLANKVYLFEATMKSVIGQTSSFRYVTHISEPVDVGTISDTGSPIGLVWYQAGTTTSFQPDKQLAALDKLRCECPVCPDAISSIPEEYANVTVNPDFGAFSPFLGKNLTCTDLSAMSHDTTRGSATCGFLQMASIFECGCPYSRPVDRPCPICSDDSPLDPELTNYVPFPNGAFLGNATCEELSWGSNMRAKLEMRDNENWCPAWQGIFGAYCGCPNPPKPPNAIGCLSEEDQFLDQMIVENFEPDPNSNGWYCGEILAWISFFGETDNVNIEEWQNALSEACCVPK